MIQSDIKIYCKTMQNYHKDSDSFHRMSPALYANWGEDINRKYGLSFNRFHTGRPSDELYIMELTSRTLLYYKVIDTQTFKIVKII